ncbi:M15 family metallopeptidase [Jannaschia seohaensis]|uniref:D-alanyl-D-alanine carboxypeptidase n=1 Tax=Jannaschia seohaensis TaxID=475081 RepID=A0A2Y9AY15_9RHOB|nr:M15 family metallopeptidase [Jannaschia seohaensis]PWJ16548.1 D-alanyl-D-alanine carboxypeptidase-like protein [Jannaschia seohaensis]SSA48785.1 D-alanyl-D-alanine carboxypeptidase [Jannaschia seohaensis]
MRQGTLIGPVIVAIGLVVAALSFAIVTALLQTADGSVELRLARGEDDLEELRREVARLDSALRDAEAELARLAEEQALLASRAPATAAPADITVPSPTITGEDDAVDHGGFEGMTDVGILAKDRFNKGITQPRNRVMLEVLGHPRTSYGESCQGVTQTRLRSLMETRQVGPIRVTMIKPALDSLERIMAKLRESEPALHDALGTAGALCVRLIRGSRSSVSNHSWGTAIDVKLQGQLDGFGDGGTQFGLLLLAELFNEEGWYWGATYNREDSMHFEVGVETLRRWQAEGLL